MTPTRQALFFCFLTMGLPLAASSEAIESGETEVQLIELFTSEGCSSCPTAERWLTTLINEPCLWNRFVPIAFHVDYWNDLGWPDPFAKPQFSQRQRTYQRQGNVSKVYTPGFVVQGDEWRGWFSNLGKPPDSYQKVGNLSLSLNGNTASIKFSPENSILSGTFYIARLGFGYERRIGRGENAGRILCEDFVILNLQQKSVELKNKHFMAKFDVAKPELDAETKIALVVWFSASGNQRPIQVVGTWVP